MTVAYSRRSLYITIVHCSTASRVRAEEDAGAPPADQAAGDEGDGGGGEMNSRYSADNGNSVILVGNSRLAHHPSTIPFTSIVGSAVYGTDRKRSNNFCEKCKSR